MLTNRTLRGKTLMITGASRGIGLPDTDLQKCRRPEIVADAAWAILVSDARATTGNFFIDDIVLAEQGTTDLSPYAVVPRTADFLPDFFID
jgi:citronellol/citronellal dehydrogenase